MSKFNVNQLKISVTSPNIFVICVDTSGSMEDYTSAMKKGLKDLKQGLMRIEEKGSIYINKITFNSYATQSGFKKLENFSTDYYANGCTSLYDAIVIGRNSLLGGVFKNGSDVQDNDGFLIDLEDKGYTPKASLYIWSDGINCCGTCNLEDAKRAVKELKKYGVAVGFISFGSDSVKVAKALGIYEGNIFETNDNAAGIKESFTVLKKSCTLQSKSSIGITKDIFKD